MAVATTIFKVRAWCDFLAETTEQVSFRKGQAFYVLSTNTESKMYFVSTQYSTPFSRTAVCGLVPISCFEVEDLYGRSSKPVPPPRTRPPSKRTAQDDKATHPSRIASTTRKQPHPVVLDKVSQVKVIQHTLASPSSDALMSHPRFQLEVQRNNYTHTIHRMFDDFIILHNALARAFPVETAQRLLPPLPAPIVNVSQLKRSGVYAARVQQQTQQLMVYMSTLFDIAPPHMLHSDPMTKFLEPRGEEELNSIEQRKLKSQETTSQAKTSHRLSNLFSKKTNLSNSRQTEFSKLVPTISHATNISKPTTSDSVDGLARFLQKQIKLDSGKGKSDYSRTAELFSSYFSRASDRSNRV